MAATTTRDFRKLIEIGIKNGQYPERLYKYRTLESAIRTLEGPSFYASSISDFNDPYEGHFVLDSNNTKQEWVQFLMREASDMNAIEIEYKARMLAADPKKARKLLEPIIHEVLQKSGVYCLSKNWNNIATWAYYSENHEGICIEYNPLEDNELCNILLPVKYSNDYLKFNYLREQNGPQKAIVQKSVCWHSEEEYRIIKNERANQIVPLNSKAITSIILGCRFIEGIKKDEKRQKLFNLLIGILRDTKYSHLKILLCEQRPDMYQLETKEIKLEDLIFMCNTK